ncbi:maltose alpha-D-glucosyltransferase [Nocardioides sp. GXZ039]|uniref:maltose alpha-D-glucosyltransferase n=1 Tax=Nocardioides sp. GXZ039 TaxID=3136018 RepID=UPI0030F3F7C6
MEDATNAPSDAVDQDQETGELVETEPVEHEPSEITYSEQFFPARPRALRPRARLRPQGSPMLGEDRTGEPVGTNPAYVMWLERSSMLHDATVIAGQFSGRGSMWQNPYAQPDPQAAIETASVWFTAYPLSFLTKPGETFLGTLGDPALWEAFEQIGINAVHTGPVKRAGGLDGWQPTPSVDGHFDRVSTEIDVAFGNEDDFRAMCEVAGEHGGTIIDDIVPGHTGKGADFRLAEMGYRDYPGVYHMVEIEPDDWHLLPDIRPGRDSANLNFEQEDRLAKAGYIVGELQRVIFHDPGIKDTNWSATAPVVGPDGQTRRWVYLHYFKEGQPSINWLDPTFAGMRLVIGDALHSLGDLGTGALRLDANGFLGVEKSAEGSPAWSEGHPLSEAANHLIASMVRKVGGFTFQELNLTIDDIRQTSRAGADLSYDFINRPAYQHALAVGDTEFLRLTLNASLDFEVAPRSLVHALQNHDELTYELVHFATLHKDDEFTFRGETIHGGDLAVLIRAELIDRLTGPHAPYNAIFTTNGIASTTASVIAGALGLESLDSLTDDDIEQIKRAHLLLSMFNAWQPGVFALSGWDLCGMLPLPREGIEHLLATGDTRWLHRGAYDLMGYRSNDPGASFTGMPRGRSLYGDLPTQLADDDSFVSGLRTILKLRRESGLDVATQLEVPAVSNRSMLVMVHELPDGRTQATVLNFSAEEISGTVNSSHFEPGSTVRDMVDGVEVGEIDELNNFSITLAPHAGHSLVVEAPAPPEDAEDEFDVTD